MPNPLPVVTLPNPSLRERSVEVDAARIGTAEFQKFLDDLIETMRSSEGVGIAAPQVGQNIRVFIIDQAGGPIACINPEIIKQSETMIENEEGCLSIPKVWGVVARAKKVLVRALDRHGRRIEIETKGFLATVFQHELDHLNGTLFIDRAPKITKGADELKKLL